MGRIILIYGGILCLFAIPLRVIGTPKTGLLVVTLWGGLLSMAIGAAALLGEKRRRWIVITSVAFVMFMAMQAITEWTAPSEGTGVVTRLVSTGAALLGFGMLLYALHGERPPEFYRPGLPQTPENDDTEERRNSSRRQVNR